MVMCIYKLPLDTNIIVIKYTSSRTCNNITANQTKRVYTRIHNLVLYV